MHYYYLVTLEALRKCRARLAHPAHRVEQPLHVVYFVLVAAYSGGPYGVAAGLCAVVTIFAMGDAPHA